jgi:signal transduction histidine kinase
MEMKFISVVIIVMSCILAYLILTILRQHKEIVTLMQERTLVEINTLERERQRIASDLHDELGPVLSIIKLMTNLLKVEESERHRVEQINQYSDYMVLKIKEISNSLIPDLLTRKGLVPALSKFIADISNLKINFSYPESLELSKEISLNLYRMILEIVHNTIKHAQANILDINIKKNRENLILTTRDDGQGFDYSSNRNKGAGLLSLENRTSVLRGEMRPLSKAGNGTTYVFIIPLNV